RRGGHPPPERAGPHCPRRGAPRGRPAGRGRRVPPAPMAFAWSGAPEVGPSPRPRWLIGGGRRTQEKKGRQAVVRAVTETTTTPRPAPASGATDIEAGVRQYGSRESQAAG